MVDRWTDSFFWPALIGAWLGALLPAAAALVPQIFMPAVFPISVVLGALAASMFAIMLMDGGTRHAANAFNLMAKVRLHKLSWIEQFFSKEYGDVRLLIVNRAVWLEAIVLIFLDRDELEILCFESFALSSIMLMLLLKRRDGFN